MPPDEAGAKAGEYPCAGRGPAAVAGGTPPPKARESDDGADAGGVAILSPVHISEPMSPY